MTKEQIAYVNKCVEDNNLIRFYTNASWLRLRKEVLISDKYECQVCKARGKYTRATHVHHVKHVRKHPELALVRYQPNGERQLISLCQACHEHCHPERMKKNIYKRPITEERWD